MNAWGTWKARVFQWEFWPFYVFYLPVMVYYLFLSVRHRSFFYFTATNPTIDFGGMTGERKSHIYELMPDGSYPKTYLIEELDRSSIEQKANEIGLPLIAKPDIGERGRGVEVIRNMADLKEYMEKMSVPFLLQELVHFPVELGVFYIRMPNESNGRITSIVKKQFLSVTGDGRSTVAELLKNELRAHLQLDYNQTSIKELLDLVPKIGDVVTVQPIGNHCRGTMFLDATHEADERLNAAIDRLAKQIDGFYYGRFDLRCASIDDLRKLENFKVVELNGVGAEPAHIYHPGFSLLKAYRIVFWHFAQMAKISRQNKIQGIPYWPLRRGIKKMLDIRSYNRRLLHP
jgi:hypothetical protein